MLNWVSLPATQVSGSVFSSLDDEKIIDSLDFTKFEEKFKIIGKLSTVQTKGSPSSPARSLQSTSLHNFEASLLEPKRIQNVAIARRKVSAPTEVLRQYITGLVLDGAVLVIVHPV